jgi:hypothetical protein
VTGFCVTCGEPIERSPRGWVHIEPAPHDAEPDPLHSVIARLLDRWRPAQRNKGTEDVWWRPGQWEPMPDSDAAIIRSHQEKS